MLQEAAGLESSLGEIWKLLAESCYQKCSGKISSAESACLVDQVKDLNDMIPIYSIAEILNNYNHRDSIDNAMSLNSEPESPLTRYWNMAITQVRDTTVQHHVFGDCVELPEKRMACKVIEYARPSVRKPAMCRSSRPC
jgi:hypothetical protein